MKVIFCSQQFANGVVFGADDRFSSMSRKNGVKVGSQGSEVPAKHNVPARLSCE